VDLPGYLATRRNLVPFGPYLALGSVLALAGGPRLHQWLFAGIFHGM
jgi:prepilin signal peptidase PulO-like enzyme (type II secretory pathway)